jgi:hydroxyacylglutathione hydrolase
MTGAGNWTWFLDGAVPALVDAGVGNPAHLDVIAQVLAGRPLARVLVTHGHPDHASGVPALRQRWPDVEIYAGAPDLSPGPVRRLLDGAAVVAGDTPLVALHTPGHAPDHFCFWDPTSRVLFSGDMLVKGSTVMIPAGRGGDLREYLASLRRLAALVPRRAYPGHGDVIDDPVALIDEYLAHRAMRESQILQCLADGIVDPDAIVARIYPAVADAIRPAARLTVDAHLAKLRDEGRIA